MKIKKVVKISAIILLSAFILILSGILLLWHNEISTVLSIKELRPRNDAHLDGAVYEMHVSGGYYFDDFIKQGGASNDADLLKFISDHITKGLASMGYKTSKVGCSSFTAKTPDGDQLFGRNYDMTQTNTCIVFTKKSKTGMQLFQALTCNIWALHQTDASNLYTTKSYALPRLMRRLTA